MRKLIRVTQDHINYGEPYSRGACPIALAFNEVFDDACSVGSQFARVGTDEPFTKPVKLPPRARNFIAEFDEGLIVAPFNFYIEVEA
jgi:hypothetical protein